MHESTVTDAFHLRLKIKFFLYVLSPLLIYHFYDCNSAILFLTGAFIYTLNLAIEQAISWANCDLKIRNK